MQALLCLFTLGAFIAASVYACLAYKQWKAVERQTNSANLNFRRDERAWMGFAFAGGNITFTQGKSFLVPTRLINSGKTPARQVHGHIIVRVVPKDGPLDFDYTEGHGNTAYVVDAGTIFPGPPGIEESFEALVHGKKERLRLTKPIMDDILNNRAFVVVWGDVTYVDIFDTEHWTHYCRYVTSPSLISNQCIKYNDADNNDK